MENKSSFEIRFDGLDTKDKNASAIELRDVILNSAENLDVKITKEDPNNQDFGGTLVLVLAAPASVVVAKGVANWLARRGRQITITGPDGEVRASGLAAGEVERIVAALSHKPE